MHQQLWQEAAVVGEAVEEEPEAWEGLERLVVFHLVPRIMYSSISQRLHRHLAEVDLEVEPGVGAVVA